MDASTYLQQLLGQIQRINYDPPISAATANAFLSTPRHRFVTRYREWGAKQWHQVTADNLERHLGAYTATEL
jgi:hypothetical protein